MTALGKHATTASATVTSDEDSIGYQIDVPVSLVAARLLTQIVGNVLSDPFNPKYRKINHAKIADKLGDAIEVLVDFGFHLRQDALLLSVGKEHVDKGFFITRQLKYHVEQLEKAGGHAAPADEKMFTQNSAMVPRPSASPLLSVQELNRAQLAVDSIIKELHKRLDVLRALFQSSLDSLDELFSYPSGERIRAVELLEGILRNVVDFKPSDDSNSNSDWAELWGDLKIDPMFFRKINKARLLNKTKDTPALIRLLLQVGFVDDDTGYYYVFPVDKPDQPVRDMLVELAVRSQALRETDAAKRQAAVAAAAARASQSARSRLLAPGGAVGAGRGNRVAGASKSNGPVPGAAAANAVVADDRKQRFLHTALTSSQDRMHALSEECDALEAQFGTPHRIEWSVSFWRSKPPAQKIYWHDVLIDEHGRAWKAYLLTPGERDKEGAFGVFLECVSPKGSLAVAAASSNGPTQSGPANVDMLISVLQRGTGVPLRGLQLAANGVPIDHRCSKLFDEAHREWGWLRLSSNSELVQRAGFRPDEDILSVRVDFAVKRA